MAKIHYNYGLLCIICLVFIINKYNSFSNKKLIFLWRFKNVLKKGN